jgi:hypothetical protein
LKGRDLPPIVAKTEAKPHPAIPAGAGRTER